jgi:hypothetical protein
MEAVTSGQIDQSLADGMLLHVKSLKRSIRTEIINRVRADRFRQITSKVILKTGDI